MEIFNEWMLMFNNNMKRQNRHVLLLVDNAAGHNNKEGVRYSHVTLEYLPPNTTSVLQPCDAGIIKSFKCQYKKLLVQHMLEEIEKKNNMIYPDIKQALYMIKNAWNNVTEQTIVNCWRHADITLNNKTNYIIEINSDLILTNIIDLLKKYKCVTKHETLNVDDYIDYENDHQVSELLSDEEIISIVKNNSEEDNDGDNEDEVVENDTEIEQPKITNKQASEMLEKIKIYFENSEGFNEKDVDLINNLGNRLFTLKQYNQITLDNFVNLNL